MTWQERRKWALPRLRKTVTRAGTYAVYLVPGMVLAAAGFRFMPDDVARKGGLGNLLHLPAYYLQAIRVGYKPRCRWIVLAPRKQVANLAALDYWRLHFIVIQSDWMCRALAPVSWMSVVSDGQRPWPNWRIKREGRLLRNRQMSYEITKAYEERFGTTKVLELSPEHGEAGRENLVRFGVPRDAWWVAIHAREAGYVRDPSHRDSDQTNRNADIRTYIPAVEHIIEQGGWVIRMGDPAMSHFPKMERVIDYVHTDMFCDWMDLFLTARCRFMLGTSSGPNLLPWVFGRPVAMVNYTSPGVYADPDSSSAIYIFKPHWSDREQRLLSFVEILQSPLAFMWSDRTIATHGVRLLDNSPDEILDLTKEMFEVLGGKAVYTGEDERRRQRFDELRNARHRFPSPTLTRLGRDFLEKYDRLLY